LWDSDVEASRTGWIHVLPPPKADIASDLNYRPG
jgi:hypothetical protein